MYVTYAAYHMQNTITYRMVHTLKKVSYISMNYVYFDYIPFVKKWIRENKEKYNIKDLEPKDKIVINPITTILDNHAEHLYEVGFKIMSFKVLDSAYLIMNL